MLDNVVDITENQIHNIAELICINCKKRWIATYPQGTLLKKLECPRCGKHGYVIKTGQEL